MWYQELDCHRTISSWKQVLFRNVYDKEAVRKGVHTIFTTYLYRLINVTWTRLSTFSVDVKPISSKKLNVELTLFLPYKTNWDKKYFNLRVIFKWSSRRARNRLICRGSDLMILRRNIRVSRAFWSLRGLPDPNKYSLGTFISWCMNFQEDQSKPNDATQIYQEGNLHNTHTLLIGRASYTAQSETPTVLRGSSYFLPICCLKLSRSVLVHVSQSLF